MDMLIILKTSNENGDKNGSGNQNSDSGNKNGNGNGNNSGNNQTIIEQWNGTSWSIVSSPNPGSGNNILGAVAATSANDVWAVGGFDNGKGTKTLVEHFC
jgi:hypothetical protein